MSDRYWLSDPDSPWRGNSTQTLGSDQIGLGLYTRRMDGYSIPVINRPFSSRQRWRLRAGLILGLYRYGIFYGRLVKIKTIHEGGFRPQFDNNGRGYWNQCYNRAILNGEFYLPQHEPNLPGLNLNFEPEYFPNAAAQVSAYTKWLFWIEFGAGSIWPEQPPILTGTYTIPYGQALRIHQATVPAGVPVAGDYLLLPSVEVPDLLRYSNVTNRIQVTSRGRTDILYRNILGYNTTFPGIRLECSDADRYFEWITENSSEDSDSPVDCRPVWCYFPNMANALSGRFRYIPWSDSFITPFQPADLVCLYHTKIPAGESMTDLDQLITSQTSNPELVVYRGPIEFEGMTLYHRDASGELYNRERSSTTKSRYIVTKQYQSSRSEPSITPCLIPVYVSARLFDGWYLNTRAGLDTIDARFDRYLFVFNKECEQTNTYGISEFITQAELDALIAKFQTA